MTVFEELVDSLKKKGLTISAAESCTGGMFAANIVGVADASKVLKYSAVTYANEAKIKFAGVKSETIDKYGVVSESVAVQMAQGISENANSDIGVGITGFAGPSGGTDDIPVGTVCFGFYIKGRTISSTKHFGNIGRNPVRELSVYYAAKTLLMLLGTEATR